MNDGMFTRVQPILSSLLTCQSPSCCYQSSHSGSQDKGTEARAAKK
jgi:hypothetical protein